MASTGLNETIINSIMSSNRCSRDEAEKINNQAILRGATLSESEMKQFDDCLPTETDWKYILAGIDNSDLE